MYEAERQYKPRNPREKGLVDYLVNEEERIIKYANKLKDPVQKEYYKGQADGLRNAISAIEAEDVRIENWPALKTHLKKARA